MFDTIILLAGEAEQVAMPPVLRAHNSLLTVISVATSADLAALSPDLLERARLIAFVTPEIVSQSILARLGYGALNFHPGSPSYPGWAPSHFALYERATEFGATVHVMVEQVDAGPIIDGALFPIPADISVLGLEGLAYAHLAQLFWRMAKSLATDPRLPPTLPIKWGSRKYSRRAYRAICDIPLDIPKDELDRRLRYSAATILECARRSICTASSFVPCCRRLGKVSRKRFPSLAHRDDSRRCRIWSPPSYSGHRECRTNRALNPIGS